MTNVYIKQNIDYRQYQNSQKATDHIVIQIKTQRDVSETQATR